MIDSDNHGTPDALTRKTTVRDLVNAFQEAEDTVRRCFAAMAEQERKLAAVFSMGRGATTIHISATDSEGRSDWGTRGVERAVCMMRRRAWRAIVERLELHRFLSVTRVLAMEKALDEEDPPPITEEQVNAFGARWAAELPTMIAEAVRESFEWIRPRDGSMRAEYATNKRNATAEIGERVVLTGIIERGMRWETKDRGFRVHLGYKGYDPQANLRALENVFLAMDGSGQFSRQNKSAIQLAIESCGKDGKWSTPYFSGRCFRNGNLHLRFLRLDLLAEFNRRAGGRNLKTENAPR